MIKSTGARVAALAVGVAAVAGLSGCGNGLVVAGPASPGSHVVSSPAGSPTSKPDGSASTPSDHPSSPKESATTSGPGQGGGSGPTAGTQTSAPPAKGGPPSGNAVTKCTLGDLKVGVQVPAGSGAAGSQYVLLTFTNTSVQPCTMYGFAGVSFVGHQNGTQLGNPAVRQRSRPPTTVRVAPGSRKAELLQIVDAGNFDPQKCQPTTSDGFRVYPPDSYTAAYVPFRTAACQGNVNQLTVYSVGIKN
ncbi:MAG: DUF4232 domain-containing protein [Microlunatus sp.]|nr:DUF4232 domain-containing protein [Microlunatus sp.]